jgi:hypothetical protein
MMPEPVPNFRVFRVYVSTQDPDKNAPVLVLYWDTPIRGKALIDPFIYEHASWGDMELRVAVFKVNGSETNAPAIAGKESATKKRIWKCGPPG